jgi:hypothetical protein
MLNTRRSLLRLATMGIGAYAGSRIPDAAGRAIRSASAQRVRAEIKGKLTWLEEVVEEEGIVRAQYPYYRYRYQRPYQYYGNGNYQMWSQFSQVQYYAYMQNLAAQYAWLQRIQQPFYNYLAQYANSYQLSQPFAMDSIQNAYSLGENARGAIGLGVCVCSGQLHVVGDRSVGLMSAAANIGTEEGWSQPQLEKATGPRANSVRGLLPLQGGNVSGEGYQTTFGSAFRSDKKFEDKNTGDKGELVAVDTGRGKEMRRVEIDG